MCITLDDFARETLPNIRDDEKTEQNKADESEDVGTWWKDDSSSEEEDDLNLTLVLESDNEAEYMEVLIFYCSSTISSSCLS